MSETTVILLNYNGSSDTVECLESLLKNLIDCTIVIVDNASTDNSAYIIEKYLIKRRISHYAGDNACFSTLNRFNKKVYLIKNDINGGFASGNNVGIKLALRCGARYLWLLNNDTVIGKNTLPAMLSIVDDSTIVGSEIRDYDQNHQIQCQGGGYVIFWRGKTIPCIDIKKQKLEYLTGASILIPRSVFERIGYLDEHFFMYWEDVEYSRRAVENGIRIAVAGDSIVYHKLNASLKREKKINSLFEAIHTIKGVVRYFRLYYAVSWVVPAVVFFIRNVISRIRFGNRNELPILAKTFIRAVTEHKKSQ